VVGLRKFFLSIIFAAVLLLVAAASLARAPDDTVVVYSAPTLAGVSDDLAELYPGRVDVRVMGSVLAANLIKAGRIPDLFLTVDAELKQGLGYRTEHILGFYRLLLVCDGYSTWVDALTRARFALADPNTAPIGYRSLAAMYLLAARENLDIVNEVRESLGVLFYAGDGGIVVDAAMFRAGGRFYVRDDLNGAYTLLENRLVDCMFAHAPFAAQKNLWAKHKVIELPDYANFLTDPPTKITVKLKSGDVNVTRLIAAAYSFTERGDRLLGFLDRLDYSKYLIERPG
jgi:molybdate/tungstate transport system substrate-binding protein